MKHFLELLEAKEDLEYLISESINELTVSEFNQLHEAGMIGNTIKKGKRFVQKVMGDKEKQSQLLKKIEDAKNIINRTTEPEPVYSKRFPGFIVAQRVDDYKGPIPVKGLRRKLTQAEKKEKGLSSTIYVDNNFNHSSKYGYSHPLDSKLDDVRKNINAIKSKMWYKGGESGKRALASKIESTKKLSDYKDELEKSKNDVNRARKIITAGLWRDKTAK